MHVFTLCYDYPTFFLLPLLWIRVFVQFSFAGFRHKPYQMGNRFIGHKYHRMLLFDRHVMFRWRKNCKLPIVGFIFKLKVFLCSANVLSEFSRVPLLTCLACAGICVFFITKWIHERDTNRVRNSFWSLKEWSPLEEGQNAVKQIRGFDRGSLFSFAQGMCAAGFPPSYI